MNRIPPGHGHAALGDKAEDETIASTASDERIGAKAAAQGIITIASNEEVIRQPALEITSLCTGNQIANVERNIARGIEDYAFIVEAAYQAR